MYATVEDLEARLRRTLEGADALAAENLLDDISGWIEGRIPGGALEHVDATYEHEGTCRTIWLPHAPKVPVAVTAVSVDGTALPDGSGAEAKGWKVTRLHGVRRADGNWWRGEVEITYTYGFSEPPGDLRDLCLDLAVRRFENPESALQLRMGADRSVSLADSVEAATGPTVEQRMTLDSYRPPAIA